MKMPLRKVTTFEYTGACRYTGYVAKKIKITLECGHENYRKASQGVPVSARCRECLHDFHVRAEQSASKLDAIAKARTCTKCEGDGEVAGYTIGGFRDMFRCRACNGRGTIAS